MINHLLVLGIAVLLICVGLSGCIQETTTTKNPIELGMIIFKIEKVTVTNELEIEELFTNETKIEVSNDTKFVIISITIENKEDKWLAVLAPIIDGSLVDDEGNTYWAKMFVEINYSIYSIEQLSLIDEEEAFGFIVDISPNSTELKKIVFTIPIDREPERLKLDCGFRANKETLVEDWFDLELEIPS